MFKEKIKQLPNTIKQTIKETFNLLWKFKWYISFDVIIFILLNPIGKYMEKDMKYNMSKAFCLN